MAEQREWVKPRVTKYGSFEAATHGESQEQWPCLFDKTIGPPDFFNQIPITDCVSGS